MPEEILDNREIFTIAHDYGFYPANLLYENRITDLEGVNFCSIAARDRSTGILIKYDADDLEHQE